MARLRLGEVATLAEGLSENVSLAISPDGQFLALALSDAVKVWRTGAWDAPVQALTHDALDADVPVVFSQDSQLLAARVGARTVKVWRVSDWSEHQTIDLGDLWYVNGIAIRGSTDLFASIRGSSFPWKVAHHAIATGMKVKDIRSPVEDEVNAVSFSPDGSRLALADYYRAVRVFRVADWQKELEIPGSFWQVQFSPDGTRLFAGGNSGGIFSVPDGSQTWAISASEGIFAPDGATIAIRKEASYSSDYYYLYDASTGALIRSFNQQGTAIRHGLFTPDGKYLLAAAKSSGWNWDEQFRVWRVSDGELILSEAWGAGSASLDPTGNYLVIGAGGWLTIKSVSDTGDALQFNDLRSWQAHSAAISRVEFAPTGNVFVSGSEDAGVKIWRVQDGGLERTLQGHVEAVWAVATARSGDDLLVAAGGWGGLAVWRVPVPGAGNTPVSTPQLVYPDPNATLDDWVLRFKATDPDSTNRLRFRVEVLTPDGTVVKRYDQTVDSSSFDKPFAGSDEVVAVSLDPALALGVYRWRVQATDGWSWSAWSEERTFTLVKPALPLGELRTLLVNAGGTWRATFTVPEGAGKLFLSCRSFEQVLNHKVTLYYGGSKIAEQTGGDILIERSNPTAGEYEMEVAPAATGQVAVYAGTDLPRVRLAGRYTGTIYHNDGYDWVQIDVPAGVRALQFTVDAPGNVTTLEVWRGYIGSWERWSAQQSFNPPVRLTINNPQAGRYYLRIKDHGSLSQSQVRQYTLTVSGAKASLSASATPGTTSAGSPDPVRFTLNYTNEGDAPASSAVLKCVLPEGLTPVEGSITSGGTFSAETRTVQWELGELGAGAGGSVEFQAVAGSAIPDGTNLTVSASIESPDMDTVSQQVAVWVGAAGVTFDNVHTVYNYVNVTLRGLSIDRSQGAPRVWLEFPAGSATGFEVDAEEVTVSEDGTSVHARFALYDKVLQDVAPRLKMSHPSVGTREWQAPTLHVFDMGADLLYNKTFVRQGRRESFNLRVTNPNRVWETPFVKLQLGLENVPPGETLTVNYWVYNSSGALLKNGSVTSASGEAAILLPQLAPGATADYKVVMQVTGSRSQIRTRIEPMTIAIVTVVSGVAIIGSWAGHSILQSGCEKAIKRRLREDFTMEGFVLDDAQINNIYNAYRQASSFASEWLAQAAAGATEQAIKDAVTAKYGEKFTKAAELAYKVGKGDHPVLREPVHSHRLHRRGAD
ncbi:MAG: hypothetical protein HPY54_07545 [Chthonomonadetes bacterium]|nr:hypothetical protein [Chthonomonadetes bacterium]